MIASRYLAKIDQTKASLRLLIIGFILMFVFNIYNWSTLQNAKYAEKVVVVPLAGGTGMWAGAGKASPEYLRAMARYITSQVGSYSAATVRRQLQELLILFPPELIGRVQVEFERLAQDIERYPSISSSIQWVGDEPLKYNAKMLQVQVRKSRLINGSESETKQVFYCISYRMESTQFQLLNIKENEGTHEDSCILPINGDVADAK